MSVPKPRPTPKRIQLDNLTCVFPNAAGLDIGSSEIVAALPPDRGDTALRAFTTFTADLKQLVSWLIDNQIDTVAMESTGIYWIPIYEMLEHAGIRVYLVNARHFKIVPGRKSDYNMPNGFRNCTRSACWPTRSGPMTRSVCSGLYSATVRN